MSNDKKQSFLSGFLAIGTGTVINMILGFISTPIITRIVDPAELGQLSIFTTYSGIAAMVLSCGFDQALFRFFYEKDDISYKRGLLKYCFSVSTAVSLITFILLFFAIKLQIQLEFSKLIMALLCLHITAAIWDRYAAYVLRLSYHNKAYATCNVLRRLSYIIIVVTFSLLLKSHFLLILVLASLASLLIATAFAILKSREMWRFKGAEKITNKAEIIKYGFPLVITMGLSTLFQAIDRLSIKAYCEYADVGVYYSAQTIISVFAIIQTTFNAVWVPMQIEHYTKHPGETTLFQKGNQYITVLMFAFGLALIALKDVIVFLLGAKYRYAVEIIPFLAMEPIFYTISETTHSGIGMSKQSYLGIYISAGACLVNYIGNTILVPAIGPRGAAISTGFSYIVFFALRTFFSNRYLYVDYKLKKLAVITIATVVYAFMATFHSSALVSGIGFFACTILLFALYRNVITDGFRELLEQIKTMRRRQNNAQSTD